MLYYIRGGGETEPGSLSIIPPIRHMDPQMERSPGIDSPRRSAGSVSRQLGTAAGGQRTPVVCNLEFTFPLEAFLLLTRLNQRNKTQPNCSAELLLRHAASPIVAVVVMSGLLCSVQFHKINCKVPWNPETILSCGLWTLA